MVSRLDAPLRLGVRIRCPTAAGKTVRAIHANARSLAMRRTATLPRQRRQTRRAARRVRPHPPPPRESALQNSLRSVLRRKLLECGRTRGHVTDACRHLSRRSPIRNGFGRRPAEPDTALAARAPRRLRASGHRCVRARRLAGRRRDGAPRDRDHTGCGRAPPCTVDRAVGPRTHRRGAADADRRSRRRGGPVPRGAAPGPRPRRRHRAEAARPEADVHPGGCRRHRAPVTSGGRGVLRPARRALPKTGPDDVRSRVSVGGQSDRPDRRREGPARRVAQGSPTTAGSGWAIPSCWHAATRTEATRRSRGFFGRVFTEAVAGSRWAAGTSR